MTGLTHRAVIERRAAAAAQAHDLPLQLLLERRDRERLHLLALHDLPALHDLLALSSPLPLKTLKSGPVLCTSQGRCRFETDRRDQRHQQQHRGRRRGARGRQLRQREGNGGLRQERDAGAERQHAKPQPNPVYERVDVQLQGGRLNVRLVASQHDVKVLGQRPSDGHIGGRLALVPSEEQLRRILPVDLSSILEQRQVRRHHLLLAIVGDLQGVVANRVMADRGLLARCQPDRLLDLERLARKAEEDQHDADVDDVPAVAPLVAADEADERGQEIGAGRPASHVRSAPEFLDNRSSHEGAECEAESGDPDIRQHHGRCEADADKRDADHERG